MGEQYTSSSGSPGTGSHPFPDQNFTGSFSMTAKVQNIGGQWEVISGSTYTIKGNLLNSGSGDILLNGTLKTGAGSFGWGTKADDEFDFSLTPLQVARTTTRYWPISLGGTGSGAIKFGEGASYNGDLTATTWPVPAET